MTWFKACFLINSFINANQSEWDIVYHFNQSEWNILHQNKLKFTKFSYNCVLRTAASLVILN